MEFRDRTAIVTGGGRGIGAALASALAEAGCRVMVADLDEAAADAVAAGLDAPAAAAACDVSEESGLRELIARTDRELGSPDIFFANAGVAPGEGPGDEDEWELAIGVNLLSHVRAARLLIPGWVERGEGWFVPTVSAAGLLSQLGSAPYTVTKHGALGFAEWLSITYGESGIRVTCLCPMGVRTGMVEGGSGDLATRSVTVSGAVLEPDDVAAETLAAVAEGRFLVLPHPEVIEFFRHKAGDYESWLAGMRKLQRKLGGPADH